jgi:ribosomal protein L7/L12
MTIFLVAAAVIAAFLFAITRGQGAGAPTLRYSTVEAALSANRKIDAIKLYREQHHVGLKEAKEAVEEIQRTMRSH